MGKTTTASKFPGALVLAFEKGYNAIPGIMAKPMNSWNDFKKVLVELKDEEPYDYIVDEQLPWYLKWSSQYIIPNLLSYGKEVIVHPCILAKRTDNQRIIDRIRTQELISMNIENVRLDSTEYIAFDIGNDAITFEKIV